MIRALFVAGSLLILVGCGSESAPASGTGGHHHVAPRGGTLVELGHHVAAIEFVFDSASGTLTAYVLDGHAANPVRLSDGRLVVEVELDGNEEYIPLELTGVANSLTGETEGDTSQFSGADGALKGVRSFGITIPMIAVRGAVFEDVVARVE